MNSRAALQVHQVVDQGQRWLTAGPAALKPLRQAHPAAIGNLLIQFHIGNLSKEKTLKSQQLFAEKVLPRLRAESKKLFARKFAKKTIDAEAVVTA